MAEGFARYYGGSMVEASSAGTEPAGLNPNAVWAMNEVGIDISHQTSEPLSAFRLDQFDWVITLCGDARDRCPALPSGVRAEHWPIQDPARSRGTPLDVLRAFRVVRYLVERRVKSFLEREAGRC